MGVRRGGTFSDSRSPDRMDRASSYPGGPTLAFFGQALLDDLLDKLSLVSSRDSRHAGKVRDVAVSVNPRQHRRHAFGVLLKFFSKRRPQQLLFAAHPDNQTHRKQNKRHI
jgi:hypothetical protein